MAKLFFLTVVASILTACAEPTVYLFSYFKGNGEDGLHLAYSIDGYQWKALNDDQSFLIPELSKDKLMRDPCIIHGADGLYHMVWTISWTENGIGYASSKDLVNWSTQKIIPVMAHEDSVRNCWAPEITYDIANKEYMIYWASTIRGRFTDVDSVAESGYNHRMYYVTTKDFNNFSKTQLLYDRGFNVIDATIVPSDNRYVMFLKDERIHPPQKNIRIAYADNLTGPYTDASTPITGDYWAEGPTVIKVNNNWIVYFDKYREHKYGAVRSDDLSNWEDVSDMLDMPQGIRHGTILEVPVSIVKNLQKND
jgi:sucrose-6-phosphate hydrolase SacC (GH32 family)